MEINNNISPVLQFMTLCSHCKQQDQQVSRCPVISPTAVTLNTLLNTRVRWETWVAYISDTLYFMITIQTARTNSHRPCSLSERMFGEWEETADIGGERAELYEPSQDTSTPSLTSCLSRISDKPEHSTLCAHRHTMDSEWLTVETSAPLWLSVFGWQVHQIFPPNGIKMEHENWKW